MWIGRSLELGQKQVETLAWKSVEAIVVEYAEQAVKAGAGALG